MSNLGSVAFNLGNYDVARTYLDEALVLQREMGEKRSLALTLCNLGMVTTSQEGSATGLALHKESLKIRWEVGDRSGQTYDLLGLAFAAAKEGDLARAVYLVASAKTLADELNFTWEKTEQNIYTQLLASTRRHLGEAEFLRLWQSGETTPVDKVVSFVLEQLPTEGL